MIAAAFASLALISSVLSPLAASQPVETDATVPPRLTAERWIVYDAHDDVVLASWNANDQAPMASVTKVMTSIVVLENAELGTLVTVPEFATRARGSTADLVAGEQLTVSDLMIAMMVRSGNDAALTLAHHVGGESVDAFVAMMNAKAAELGMTSTSFANPAGLDAEGHYSTARDLLTLIIAAEEYPDIARMARINLVTLPPGANGKERVFTNTNRLLGAFPGNVGLKTGDTPWADKVLLGVTERAGRPIYSVVMHSDDHFADTREIVEWAFTTYSVQDRWLRPLYTEQGGGGTVTDDLELTESHERRLRAMTALPDGRWRTSSLEELPKAEIIGRWIREAIPEVAGG
jgi:D-alanyl-D-alanine carboxypeptidase